MGQVWDKCGTRLRDVVALYCRMKKWFVRGMGEEGVCLRIHILCAFVVVIFFWLFSSSRSCFVLISFIFGEIAISFSAALYKRAIYWCLSVFGKVLLLRKLGRVGRVSSPLAFNVCFFLLCLSCFLSFYVSMFLFPLFKVPFA